MNKKVVRSACRGCHGVCQVLVHMEGGRVVRVTGDPESPISRGYLCPKGAASPELLYHPDRLTHPLRRVGKRGESRWKRIPWEEALDEIAGRFAEIKAESGSEYVAVGQGTGRPLIEFTARFANAFGTPNFVAPSHVCYAPRVAASKITLGQLPVTDVYGFGGKDPAGMMIWGCNITHSASADGMCGGMIERALKKVHKLIVVDPRSLLILRAITGNIDCPGGDVLWVPPKGIYQKSIFTNPDQEGARFLPPEKRRRAVTQGRFPFEKAVHPPTFWKSVVAGEPYKVRAMWIAACNPLLSQTPPLVIEEALRGHLEFTVVSEFFMTPTAALADIVLPAAMWLETDDIVNLHKIWCVLARKEVARIGEVRDNREVILQLARRLNLDEAFPWKDYHDYLQWILKESGMTFEEFCHKGMLQGEMRYYKYKENGFETPSGKFEIYSGISEDMGLSPLPVYREPALSPVSSPEALKEYPLILTTGARTRVYFVSEGRQIKSLRKINPDPLVEIHPETARSLGIRDGDWVWIETFENRVRMRASFFDGMAPDVVSAQHAWWFPEEGPPGYGWKKSNVNLLFGDRAGYDPETGSEPLRSSLCRVYPV